jgi:hypothetical protein
MNLERQFEFLHKHEIDDRARRARWQAQVELARAANCAQRECHPVAGRISELMLSFAIRFHCWATPSSRWKATAFPCGCSS